MKAEIVAALGQALARDTGYDQHERDEGFSQVRHLVPRDRRSSELRSVMMPRGRRGMKIVYVDMDNVLVSPHSASTAPSENRKITDIFIHNLGCWLDGRPAAMRNILDKKRMY